MDHSFDFQIIICVKFHITDIVDIFDKSCFFKGMHGSSAF